jgi:PAS domain S-box-containing protein
MGQRTRARSDAGARAETSKATLPQRSRSRIAAKIDPIITMDSGGIIQSASDSVEHVFGWTPTELFGKNVKVLIPEPKRSALDRYLDRYRHTDRAPTLSRTRRFDAIRKDGSGVQIELSISRADIPRHSAPFFIGIIRDVSGEIDVGIDPADDRERLQQLVTEQTRALATGSGAAQRARAWGRNRHCAWPSRRSSAVDRLPSAPERCPPLRGTRPGERR